MAPAARPATSATCGSTHPGPSCVTAATRTASKPSRRDARLARDLRDAGLGTANTRDVVERAASGEPTAVRAVRTAGRRLGEVLAAAVNMLNPDVIVVGGDLADAHDQLLAGVREVVYQRSTALATQTLRIEESRLGPDAGIEGCIVVALEELLSAEVIDELIEQGAASESTA